MAELLDILAAKLQGRVPRLYVNASRLLVRADTLGGIIENTSPGSMVLTLPTMAQLGYTRIAANPQELFFVFGRGDVSPAGTPGPLFVTPAVYQGAVASQAAMTALSGALPGDVCVRSDLSNQRFFLAAGGSYSIAGSWTAVPLGSVNNPPLVSRSTGAPLTAGQPAVAINWNGLDPQYVANGSPPVTIVSNGLDSYLGG